MIDMNDLSIKLNEYRLLSQYSNTPLIDILYNELVDYYKNQ